MTGVGFSLLQSFSKIHFVYTTLWKTLSTSVRDVRSCRLTKGLVAEAHRQEERWEQKRVRYEEERAEERRRYEQERAEERGRYKELLRGLTERRPRCVEVGPESLKLTKLSETDDIEAFLTTFKTAVEAHGMERDKHAAILAPQLTGKARLAFAAINDEDARDYDRVKAATFQCYDINEETYRRRFRGVQPKENETANRKGKTGLCSNERRRRSRLRPGEGSHISTL